MKRTLIFVLTFAALLLANTSRTAECQAAPATQTGTASLASVGVDARVELVAIVFRLAGNREYNMCRIGSYDRDLKSHFEPFKNHPAVELARSLPGKSGVGYDAPMSLAVRLPRLEAWKEGVPLTLLTQEGLDQRWQADELKEFLTLLPQFRKDSKFDEFFKAHDALFRLTTERANEVLREARLAWFVQFFGAHSGARFHVVLGLTNGPECYGPNVKMGGVEHLYSILGVWGSDLLGQPQFSSGMVGTIVHEFGHSYVNPLVFAHQAELKSAGEKLFERVKEPMAQQAYGSWTTMMLESLNRACEVRYQLANKGPEAAQQAIRYNVGRSFLWTGELANVLGEYEAHRDQYPTLEAFFPKIVAFFNDYADKLPEVMKKIKAAQAQAPKVVKTIPAAGEQNVDPALKELVVVFDREMKTGGFAWTMHDTGTFPTVPAGAHAVWRDAHTCILPVTLEPGRSYTFGINGGQFTGFRALNDTPAEAVVISFTTRAQEKK